MDRGAWWDAVYRVPKSQTQLSDQHFFLFFVCMKLKIQLSEKYNPVDISDHENDWLLGLVTLWLVAWTLDFDLGKGRQNLSTDV